MREKGSIYLPLAIVVLSAAIVGLLFINNHSAGFVEEIKAIGKTRYYSTPSPDPNSSDKTPPTVSVTSPSEGAVLKKGSAISVQATATDDAGGTVLAVWMSPYANLDSNLVCDLRNTSPYSCVFSAPNKPGQYKITVYAYDYAGNSSLPVVINITLQ